MRLNTVRHRSSAFEFEELPCRLGEDPLLFGLFGNSQGAFVNWSKLVEIYWGIGPYRFQPSGGTISPVMILYWKVSQVYLGLNVQSKELLNVLHSENTSFQQRKKRFFIQSHTEESETRA